MKDLYIVLYQSEIDKDLIFGKYAIDAEILFIGRNEDGSGKAVLRNSHIMIPVIDGQDFNVKRYHAAIRRIGTEVVRYSKIHGGECDIVRYSSIRWGLAYPWRYEVDIRSRLNLQRLNFDMKFDRRGKSPSIQIGGTSWKIKLSRQFELENID